MSEVIGSEVANNNSGQQVETVMTEAPSSNAVDANVENDISTQSEVSTMEPSLEERINNSIRDEQELKAKIYQSTVLYKKSIRSASLRDTLREIFPELSKTYKGAKFGEVVAPEAKVE